MDDSLLTKQRFSTAMLTLYKSFGKLADKDITRVCYHALEHLSIEDAEKCIEIAILNGDTFPTPHALRRYISMIPAKPLARLQYNPTTNTALANDASKLINAVLEGKLTERQLIEGMEVMEKKYPNIGWQSEASQLVTYYRNRDDNEQEKQDTGHQI